MPNNPPDNALAKYDNVILASKSPRRSDILDEHGIKALIMPVDVDESLTPGISFVDAVKMLSYKKALAAVTRPDIEKLRGLSLIIAATMRMWSDCRITGLLRNSSNDGCYIKYPRPLRSVYTREWSVCKDCFMPGSGTYAKTALYLRSRIYLFHESPACGIEKTRGLRKERGLIEESFDRDERRRGFKRCRIHYKRKRV